MGSYAIYGGAGVVNVAINAVASEVPSKETVVAAVIKKALPITESNDVVVAVKVAGDAESLEMIKMLNDIGISDVVLTNGHIFISGISAIDIGSTTVIMLTAFATLVRAYYDFSDWLDRRKISKLVLRRAEGVDKED